MEPRTDGIFNGQEIAKSKAEERQQKLTEIRRKQRNRMLYVVIAIVIVFLGSFQLYRSGIFNVKKIDVTGNKYVGIGKIDRACNITVSTNILRVSTGEIKSKLMKDPWIESVSVYRAFPSTIRINIKERVPAAMISYAGKFYMVDDEQFVIASRAYAEGLDVPVITDLQVGKITIGDRLINPSLENALRSLASMDPSFKKTINLISASSVNKLSLYNKDNIEILYGDAKLAHEKNRVIQSILSRQGKQVIFIDIRSYPQADPVLRRLDSVP